MVPVLCSLRIANGLPIHIIGIYLTFCCALHICSVYFCIIYLFFIYFAIFLLFNKDNKLKEAAKIDSSFTRFSTKYFCRVISALSPHQKTIIQGAGFQNLLEFNSNYVPNKFATWIAKHVDFKTSQIILRDKVISVTKQTVCDIFGLPSGGLEFGKDFEVERNTFFRCMGLVVCLREVLWRAVH